MKRKLIILLLLLPFLAKAQDDAIPEEEVLTPCVQNIEIAQQRYDEGRIQDIEPLLNDCLAQGEYNKAQKSQVLRLLTLTYIFLEEEEKAEATMLELLHTNHEFQVDPSIDPTEFINLHERFRYKPIFNVGIKFFANISQPIVTGVNSSLNLSDSRPDYPLSNQLSPISFGVNFEWEFIENFVLYPEIQYRLMTVTQVQQQPDIRGLNSTFMQVTNVDKMQWLSVPVSVKYLLHLQNVPSLKFYVNLGGSLDYLLKSEKPGDEALLEVENAPPVGSTSPTTADKNRLNFGLIGGAGVTLKLGEGFLSLEARYLYNFNTLQKSENIIVPSEPALIDVMLQDDVYRLNHIALSVGYTLNIYIPKQLR